ncbi:HTH-type transcriptional regulator TtgR [compost metagenome]
MCEIRQQRQGAVLDCHQGITLALANAVRREQLPSELDVERAAVAMFAYVDGLIGRWLLLPDSFDLLRDVELWVDTGLDMLRLSPALRK